MRKDNQHAFIPFDFDTFGFLAPKVVDLLYRVQKVTQNNVITLRSTNVVFTSEEKKKVFSNQIGH